jgi:hypothetical protein
MGRLSVTPQPRRYLVPLLIKPSARSCHPTGGYPWEPSRPTERLRAGDPWNYFFSKSVSSLDSRI